MFLAGIGILAALVFVLGLGALSIWALKRFSNIGLSPRSRVPVEVVQRISLGPKTGLAVVRVGEKVMAVSIGDGGIRPLFELDEADRQRVISSSSIATPLASSDAASAAFSGMIPAGWGARLSRVLPTHAVRAAAEASTTNVSSAPVAAFALPVAPSFASAMASSSTPNIVAATSNAVSSNANTPAPQTDDFLSVLRMSLKPTTRLAGILLAVALTSGLAPKLYAQVAPPVNPPATQQVIPPAGTATTTTPVVATPAATPIRDAATLNAASATRQTLDSMQRNLVQSLQQSAATLPLVTAPPVAPANRNRGARAAVPATPTGNGSSVSPQTPNGARPLSDMRAPAPAASPNQERAAAATTAPVAGGQDALAQMVPQMDIRLGDSKDGGLRLNGTVGIVVMMGLLTLLPTLLLMMTGFTRILIVLHFLKQAMGTQGAPPAHLLAALALLLTGFVMAPTFSQMNKEAITPWLDGKMTQVEMMKTGVQPMREFMLKQTRPSDLKTFIEMSRMEQPDTPDDVPLHVLMSAFVASELRTAFQIGFAIYLPFIVIDAVVASVLMSMGMFMLPPAMISLPFKLLLFVLVDGWALTITSLVQSFRS